MIVMGASIIVLFVLFYASVFEENEGTRWICGALFLAAIWYLTSH